MNRRTFAQRAMAMLGAVAVAPALKLFTSKPWSPTSISPASGMSIFKTTTWRYPVVKPDRRILVMVSWLKEGIRETDYLEKPLPRFAYHWRELPFEKLRRGDHFRMVDDPSRYQYETGRIVYVAASDCTDGQTVFVSGSYTARGAGFDLPDEGFDIVGTNAQLRFPAHAAGNDVMVDMAVLGA